MKLSDVPGLQMASLDPAELPPPPVDGHPLIYNMWKASGHAETSGQTFSIGDREWSGQITCVACHDPHQSEQPHQLVLDSEDLCAACHKIQEGVVIGKGAKGIEATRSLHTAISCVECHMTEKNHLMKVLRPDDPKLAEDRTDTCSACHEVKDRSIRTHQIQDWEAWYRESMEPVEAAMQAVTEALKKNPDALNAELSQKLADTKANLSIIEQDGSGGVHNLDYALEIMALAKRDLAKIEAAIK
jgi:predicted CXXCH cytochrome family protein